jgi:ABC-type nitrate/sulfonate/bicarbonate transport system substrate-binding protein
MRRPAFLSALGLALYMPAIAGAQAQLAPKIALNFTWQAAYMPLLYGESKGFFKDAGIAPDFVPTRGSDQALQLIESGQVDYAFVDADSFLAAAA